MTPIEKARAALAKERARKEEFYEGAAYALKLAEAAQVGETPKTNCDRVRAMSDEALAAFAVCDCCTTFGEGKCIAKCKECALAWIRREAER